jgi:hypothetical protein
VPEKQREENELHQHVFKLHLHRITATLPGAEKKHMRGRERNHEMERGRDQEGLVCLFVCCCFLCFFLITSCLQKPKRIRGNWSHYTVPMNQLLVTGQRIGLLANLEFKPATIQLLAQCSNHVSTQTYKRERDREEERVCVFVTRERECVCVCVCVKEREGGREKAIMLVDQFL